MGNDWSPDVYIRVYRYAAGVHWNSDAQQPVPGTDIPYLMHFSMVAMEVIAALGKEPSLNGDLAVQCALLHDTIEDTDTTYDQLVDAFGFAVADGVQAPTEDEAIGKDLPKQQRKKRQMADSLERVRQQPKEIWMVKMGDRITNLQPPPEHWTQEKISRYRGEACQIQQALKDASPYLAARLQEKIVHYPG
jgi:(p)ppGpp synthase/HD superfamily hydrolase